MLFEVQQEGALLLFLKYQVSILKMTQIISLEVIECNFDIDLFYFKSTGYSLFAMHCGLKMPTSEAEMAVVLFKATFRRDDKRQCFI